MVSRASPRDEWANTSVQAVMIPRDKILWATPEEPLLALLERLLAADVGYRSSANRH